jgi:ribosomal protein L11 methyltransferase
MNWLQIAINTTKNHAETAENCLFAAGAQTVTLTDAADQPILEPGVDETPVWNKVIITGLFNDENHTQTLLDIISQQLGNIEHSCHTEILEDQNWTRAWMEHFHAMQFGERLWVCPLHIEPPNPSAVNLRLDPGLAFGTGTHPTTSLCLRWLDKNIKTQQTLLDYGCGSGILAIAACMLGVTHSDGVDIDPQALTATMDNAEVNHVTAQIECLLPADYNKQHTDTQYDIVVANILSGPLAELAPTLAHHTRTGGDIILSGILKEQADAVLDSYREFFKMDTPEFEEDWVLLHGVKI